MTDPQRPTFYEGQVLAAADLNATVEYPRTRAARHDRYLHDWGIAEGLALATQPQTDPGTGANFVTITLQPGVAIDGTGREVAVLAAAPLSEAAFQERNGADPATPEFYPVFLAGLDRPPVTGPVSQGACGTSTQQNRIDESYQILFGGLGDERLVAEQQPPAVADGPGDGSTPWLILIGYVAWTNGHFTAVASTARGVAVRYSGVRADTVAARGGTLALRARPGAVQGGAVVTVNDTAGFTFGRYKGDGSVDTLMSVTPAGDLTVRGNIAGDQQAGGVAAVSGVATDGMILPLPAGIDPDQVASGRTTLHVLTTPRVTGAPPDDTGVWLAGPVESTVDKQLRVRCRMRWYRLDSSPAEFADLPNPVEFLVLAAVAANPAVSGGSGN
ncbi:MAG: hypothetical protein J2P15_18825 [Micromonosporaceae bacterium]|nr:hypothetical protein [Micromonosporaceae bacterium]